VEDKRRGEPIGSPLILVNASMGLRFFTKEDTLSIGIVFISLPIEFQLDQKPFDQDVGVGHAQLQATQVG